MSQSINVRFTVLFQSFREKNSSRSPMYVGEFTELKAIA